VEEPYSPVHAYCGSFRDRQSVVDVNQWVVARRKVSGSTVRIVVQERRKTVETSCIVEVVVATQARAAELVMLQFVVARHIVRLID
jgi:hypothetical protein